MIGMWVMLVSLLSIGSNGLVGLGWVLYNRGLSRRNKWSKEFANKYSIGYKDMVGK